ncbi:MAG: hypothetical protein ABI192_13695 [Bradyrhizobium sp.]
MIPVTKGQSNSRVAAEEPTPANPRALNHLLQAMSEADFEALRPHLQSVEMVKEAVLIETDAPLTHVCLPESGIISMMVRLSEGQTIELAMIGRDSILAGANEGVQRNVVSIIAHGLQQAGIIGYNHGRMEIYDPEGLKNRPANVFGSSKPSGIGCCGQPTGRRTITAR